MQCQMGTSEGKNARRGENGTAGKGMVLVEAPRAAVDKKGGD